MPVRNFMRQCQCLKHMRAWSSRRSCSRSRCSVLLSFIFAVPPPRSLHVGRVALPRPDHAGSPVRTKVTSQRPLWWPALRVQSTLHLTIQVGEETAHVSVYRSFRSLLPQYDLLGRFVRSPWWFYRHANLLLCR